MILYLDRDHRNAKISVIYYRQAKLPVHVFLEIEAFQAKRNTLNPMEISFFFLDVIGLEIFTI